MSVTLRLDQVKRYSVGGFVFEKGKPTVVNNDKLAAYLRGLTHENGHKYFSVYETAKPEPLPEADVVLKESVFDEKPTDAELAELYNDPSNIPTGDEDVFVEMPDEVESNLKTVLGGEDDSGKRGRPKKNKNKDN